VSRINFDHVEAQIVEVQYHEFPGTLMIVCCITLRNGFQVVGQAACADPRIFDEFIGRGLAYKDATNKIWMLEGYLLKEKLWVQEGNSPLTLSDYPN